MDHRPAAGSEASAEVSGSTIPAFSWQGYTALTLFGIHVALLFFPPLPPYWKGSLWSYLLGYSSVLFGALELARLAPLVARRWGELSVARRTLSSYGAAVAVVVLGWAVQLRAPQLFERFNREEGLWEPVTLFLYLGAVLVLVAAARATEEAGRAKHLRLVAGPYAFIGLEEVDYFGIIGGIIGRIDGVYAGSVHDLLRLWAEGLVPLPITVVIVVLIVACIGLLWRSEYLQPARLARSLSLRRLLWLFSGAGLVVLALAAEAHVFGLATAHPWPEEVLELGGGVLLATLALDLVGAAGSSRPDRPG